MRDFEGREAGASFIYSFLIFAFRDGIGDDAATSLNVGAAVFCDESTQRDAGIEVAREIEIENRASVDSAARGFEFVDDLHGADFWRAGNGASGKAGHECVEAIETFAQLAGEAGDQMHGVRVAFDEHQLFDGD